MSSVCDAVAKARAASAEAGAAYVRARDIAVADPDNHDKYVARCEAQDAMQRADEALGAAIHAGKAADRKKHAEFMRGYNRREDTQ